MNTNGRTQIVSLGGGFGGVYTAMHLEEQLAHEPNVEITLVDRENFFCSRRCYTKKLRVMLDRTLDLVFSKDLVQCLTLRAPTVSHVDDGEHVSRR